MVYTFFDKKNLQEVMLINEIEQNQQLAEKLHKPIFEKN